MRRRSTMSGVVAVGALAIAGAALGQAPASGHAVVRQAASAAVAPAALPLVEGEVRKIDQAQGRLTLRHGPIANLDMPGMTMVFKVADTKLLDGIKVGDKVKFAADRRHGAITVTTIEVIR